MKTLLLIIFSVCCLFAKAQINITPFLPEDIHNQYPDAAKIMEGKMNNIISSNGIKSEMGESRFILTGNWATETKDIVGGSPTKIAYTLNINLYIGDGEEGTKYISETFRVKGVGSTEEKAHLAAIRNLQGNSTKMSEFVKKGKERIISYYETNKANLQANIHYLITKQDYDEAIYQLCLIPMECSYYLEAQAQIDDIYQRIIDNKSERLYIEAKAIWASDQTVNGANQVIELVSQIDPNASCFTSVQNFISIVTSKINLINERAYADYQKKLAHRQEMDKLNLEAQREQNRLNAEVTQARIEADASVEKTRLETNAKNYAQYQQTEREKYQQTAVLISQGISASERLQSQRISAARDLAVTYAQNRPKKVVYKVNNWY